jgi:hypothetical protein
MKTVGKPPNEKIRKMKNYSNFRDIMTDDRLWHDIKIFLDRLAPFFEKHTSNRFDEAASDTLLMVIVCFYCRFHDEVKEIVEQNDAKKTRLMFDRIFSQYRLHMDSYYKSYNM